MRALFASLLLLTACHHPRIPDGGNLRVSLRRVPRHQHASAMPACAVVGDIAVADQRGTDHLGEQLLEYAQPGETVPVVSVNDPGPWLADVARGVGTESMVRFSPGVSTLQLTLRAVAASETFNGAFGSMYRSRVVFDAQLNGFTGTFDADAEQYGADQSMDNLLESVNEAAEKALTRLYDDPGFRAAVCGSSSVP